MIECLDSEWVLISFRNLSFLHHNQSQINKIHYHYQIMRTIPVMFHYQIMIRIPVMLHYQIVR